MSKFHDEKPWGWGTKIGIVVVITVWLTAIGLFSYLMFSAVKASGAERHDVYKSSFGISAQQVFEMEAYEVTWFARHGQECYIIRSRKRSLANAGIAIDCHWRR